MKRNLDYQYPVRMTYTLKDSIDEVCEGLDVNPAEYIRKSLARCVAQDKEQLTSAEEHLVFLR
jgi:hypothetical protein